MLPGPVKCPDHGQTRKEPNYFSFADHPEVVVRAARNGGQSLDGNLAAMDRSRIIPAQVRYWDRVAGEKRFSHPLRIAWLTRHAVPRARILDFGCGHGRTVAELLRGGYKNIIGIDFSPRQQNLWVVSGSGSRPSV